MTLLFQIIKAWNFEKKNYNALIKLKIFAFELRN
tara:strand:- start:396 stop:497 length:102 start_codon:yes stop_codon:yes gene_type:complete